MAMARRPYNSPIREARAAETRGRILDAVRTIFETDPESSLNFDEVAKVSGEPTNDLPPFREQG